MARALLAAAALLCCALQSVLCAPPTGLIDYARPAAGARARSSHDGPLCWGPSVGTFADGLSRYCTSVDAVFDGVDKTFWAEVGGEDAEVPHPSPKSPAWVCVDFALPVRLRGARVLFGTSSNYTLEVSAAGSDGPWRVVASHGCGEDLGCELGFPATYCGGYDPSPEARRREVTHTFDTGARVAHARWRNTWANLGGYACGDVCLWSNVLFELELWGDPLDSEEDQSGQRGVCAAAGAAQQGGALPEPALRGAGGAAAAAAALGGQASG